MGSVPDYGFWPFFYVRLRRLRNFLTESKVNQYIDVISVTGSPIPG
jgi:hypothetical protein